MNFDSHQPSAEYWQREADRYNYAGQAAAGRAISTYTFGFALLIAIAGVSIGLKQFELLALCPYAVLILMILLVRSSVEATHWGRFMAAAERRGRNAAGTDFPVWAENGEPRKLDLFSRASWILGTTILLALSVLAIIGAFHFSLAVWHAAVVIAGSIWLAVVIFVLVLAIRATRENGLGVSSRMENTAEARTAL